jgi:hypothetical protein
VEGMTPCEGISSNFVPFFGRLGLRALVSQKFLPTQKLKIPTWVFSNFARVVIRKAKILLKK